MNALWANLLSRNRAAVPAVLLALALLVVHALGYRPLLARYQRATRQAAQLGMPLGAVAVTPAVPPRVTALLTDNSLTVGVAEEQGTSGALTATLLDDITRLAARSGLQVLATEQGLVTQLPGSVMVRAHLRMRGSYAAFVGLLGELTRTRTLVSVDRFAIQQSVGGASIELWVTQIVLKRTARRP